MNIFIFGVESIAMWWLKRNYFLDQFGANDGWIVPLVEETVGQFRIDPNHFFCNDFCFFSILSFNKPRGVEASLLWLSLNV